VALKITIEFMIDRYSERKACEKLDDPLQKSNPSKIKKNLTYSLHSPEKAKRRTCMPESKELSYS
jgi:adenine C2-methylase RlmN of 23S rRNA A2503 and tRNA A37